MQLPLRLPIGHDIFGELIEKQLDFVDKTLFIQQILDNTTKVLVITRPRRFGKTLNLSMLHHFLASQAFMYTTQGMFDHLKIAAQGEKYMCHQGQYPVIFITLKGIFGHNFEVVYQKMCGLIANLYGQHLIVFNSGVLNEGEQQFYRRMLRKEAQLPELCDAIKNLINYLSRYYQKKVWLLIDEYDSPIQSAYLHGYYDDMMSLMRAMLGEALKTSPYLEKAVITGILRIAKESLFSGLNNVKVCTFLDDEYSECFGFTESEMVDLFHRSGLDHDIDKIRNWYTSAIKQRKRLWSV